MTVLDLTNLRQQHDRLLRRLDQAIDAEAKAAAEFGVAAAKNSPAFNGPPGALRNSAYAIVRRRGKKRIVTLRNPHPGAFAQDKGSGVHGPKRAPYVITPRRKRALAFWWSGGRGGQQQFFVRRWVLHPGVPATHFLFNANRKAFDHAGVRLEQKMAMFGRQFGKLRS